MSRASPATSAKSRHPAETGAGYGQGGEIGDRLPLARREQHGAISLAQSEGDSQVVERKKTARPLGHLAHRLGGIGSDRQQPGDLQQRLGRAQPLGRRLTEQRSLHQQRHLGRDQRTDLRQKLGVVLVIEIGPDASRQEPDR